MFYSFNDFERDIKEAVLKLKDKNYDAIVCPLRGAMTITQCLSYALEIPYIVPINIKRVEQEDGSFDEETAGLILENIYIRRELVDLCNGDPSELSPEKLQILQTKYEDMIIKKVGFDNKELQVKLESERREKLKIEQEKKLLLSGLRDKAIKKARESFEFLLLFSLFLNLNVKWFAFCPTHFSPTGKLGL